MQLNKIYAFAHNLLKTKIVYDKMIALVRSFHLDSWRPNQACLYHFALRIMNACDSLKSYPYSHRSGIVSAINIAIMLIILHIFSVFFFFFPLCAAVQFKYINLCVLESSRHLVRQTYGKFWLRKEMVAHPDTQLLLKHKNVCPFTRFYITIRVLDNWTYSREKNVCAYTRVKDCTQSCSWTES